MPNINELSQRLNTRTLNFVLLSLVTLGVYPLMWLYRKQSIISDITKAAITSDLYVIWIAVCFGISHQLALMGTTDPEMYGYDPMADTMAIISTLLSVACAVLYIIWAFRARTALQNYVLNTFRFELKMNVFYLVIFNVFYITYCINAMPEAMAKHKIIHGERPAVDTPPAASGSQPE